MRKFTHNIFSLILLIFAFFYSVATFADLKHDSYDTPLKTAWEPWFPYEYLKIPTLQSSLTGLDIELVKQIATAANQSLQFHEVPWDKTLPSLEKGQIDLATGASYSADRASYVYYSKPYRYEENSLFVLRAKNKIYNFNSVDKLIAFILTHHFRLGYNKGTILADEKLNRFIQDPKNAKYVVSVENESHGIAMLLNHDIDGYIADRIVGSTLIWQAGASHKLAEHYLHMRTPIYLVFSKKSVPFSTVQAFNKAIDQIQHNVIYRNDFSWYLYPVIMMQVTEEQWFKMLDTLGILFFSISGVLLAYTLNKSFLSAFFYAMLPSLTGGILRDIILSNRPVEALRTPSYLILIFTVVLIGYLCTTLFNKIMQYEELKKSVNVMHPLVLRVKKILNNGLIICDALGLATLSVSGVMISLMAKVQPLWLWGPFFAFMTACFGTIIRDIISKNERLEDVVGDIYSEIAIFWSFFLSIALLYSINDIHPDRVRDLILLTVAGGFVTRLVIYYLKVPNVYFK